MPGTKGNYKLKKVLVTGTFSSIGKLEEKTFVLHATCFCKMCFFTIILNIFISNFVINIELNELNVKTVLTIN